MTLELADGRGELFQWDAGRIIEFGDDTVSQAHFTSIEKITDIPYTIEVKNRKAAIPDELLQVSGTLIVYAWVSDTNGGYTKVQVNFPVFTRPKPSDYVYTPDRARWLRPSAHRDRRPCRPDDGGKGQPRGGDQRGGTFRRRRHKVSDRQRADTGRQNKHACR